MNIIMPKKRGKVRGMVRVATYETKSLSSNSDQLSFEVIWNSMVLRQKIYTVPINIVTPTSSTIKKKSMPSPYIA